MVIRERAAAAEHVLDLVEAAGDVRLQR